MSYTNIGMYIGTDSLGGYQVENKIAALAFHTPQPLSVLRQFIDMKMNLGKKAGDTVFRNKWGDISSAGAQVVESGTIPVDRYSALAQSTATVSEFGNSISVKSALLDLANLDVSSEIVVVLRNDERRAIDSFLYTNVYNAAVARYVGTSATGYALTTNGTATATCTSALNAYHIRQMRKLLRSKNAVPFANGRYAMICSLSAADGLRDDADWKNAQLYGMPGAGGMVNGYIGTLHGVDFYEENASFDDSIGSANITGEAFMFGANYATEDLVSPVEIRSNLALQMSMGSANDFGREVELAWYEMAAFGTLWNVAANYACIKWDSA